MIARKQHGISALEVVVGVAILTIALVGLIGGLRFFLATGLAGARSVKAHFLLEEGFEAVRSIRDDSYETYIAPLSTNTVYFLTFSGGTWSLTTTPSYIDHFFYRTVTFDAVRRNGNDDIVLSGGSVDPDTMAATVSVAWNIGGATTTKSATGYFTNLFDN